MIAMAYPITQIEGIGETYGARLRELGIQTTADLLSRCGSRTGRKQLSEAAEIPETLILTWTNHADLMRIKGIGGQYSELLEAAGVDSVAELKQRNAANLHARLLAVNEEFGLSGNIPSEGELEAMIAEAKTMEAMVHH
jgi:predicted flap endonuclease-1-like 5' DNA nuclease